MSTSEDLTPIFKEAIGLLEEREPILGDSWKSKADISNSVSQILRKARYLEAMYSNGKTGDVRFVEDLLDIMNWAAMTVWFVRKGGKE